MQKKNFKLSNLVYVHSSRMQDSHKSKVRELCEIKQFFNKIGAKISQFNP